MAIVKSSQKVRVTSVAVQLCPKPSECGSGGVNCTAKHVAFWMKRGPLTRARQAAITRTDPCHRLTPVHPTHAGHPASSSSHGLFNVHRSHLRPFSP